MSVRRRVSDIANLLPKKIEADAFQKNGIPYFNEKEAAQRLPLTLVKMQAVCPLICEAFEVGLAGLLEANATTLFGDIENFG